MTDAPSASPSAPEPREPEDRSSGLGRWLFNPKRRRFLLPATGAWILALDWLLFSTNTVSAWMATPFMMVVGFVLGSAGTYMIQRKTAGDGRGTALVKAALAGVVVGLPLPIGGTLVGTWVLFFSGLGSAKEEVLDK